MKIKVKKGKATQIIDTAVQNSPVPLYIKDVDKNTLLYLRRLAKKTKGMIKIKSTPQIIVKGFPIKKKSNHKYDLWEI